MPGLVLLCDTGGCVSRYDGGNGGDKPGPYRPRGYHFSEKVQIRKDARYLGWLTIDNEDFCPCCANKIYDSIYKELPMAIEVTTHLVTDSPMSTLRIEAHGEPGPGGAPNQYIVTGMDFSKNPLFLGNVESINSAMLEILFQHGNPVPDGPNGITIEVLLAICAHRLEGFQKGPYAHEKNAIAMDKIYGAIDALKSRELSYLKPEEPAPTDSKPLFRVAGPLEKGALSHLVRYFEIFSKSTVEAINTGFFSDKATSMMERDIANLENVSPDNKRDLLESVEVLRGSALPRGYMFAAPAKITDTEVVAAVMYLRQNIHLFSRKTLFLVSAGHVSDDAANSMLMDINASRLGDDLKGDLIAAVEKVRGKSVVTLKEVPGLDENPERVVKIEGINNASYFSGFPIREIKPEDATIEVRISTDARQSGTDLLMTRILSMLIEKGYTTIGHTTLRDGEDQQHPSGFVGDEEGLMELYGPENGPKVIKSLQDVKVVVVQDIDASVRKTRQ